MKEYVTKLAKAGFSISKVMRLEIKPKWSFKMLVKKNLINGKLSEYTGLSKDIYSITYRITHK